MQLPVPPEPKEIKESIKRYRSVFNSVPDVEYDSLAVWYNNQLPSYLWRYWKAILEGYGYTWQKFVKVMRYATENIIDWALYDNLEWNELIKRISKLLERYAATKG